MAIELSLSEVYSENETIGLYIYPYGGGYLSALCLTMRYYVFILCLFVPYFSKRV